MARKKVKKVKKKAKKAKVKEEPKADLVKSIFVKERVLVEPCDEAREFYNLESTCEAISKMLNSLIKSLKNKKI